MNRVNVAYSVPTDCIDLINALVARLGGHALIKESDDAEVATIPPIPEKERPGRMLKGLRLREGLTQKQIAGALNVPQSHISEYEKGKRPIPAAKADILASLLNSVPGNFLPKDC